MLVGFVLIAIALSAPLFVADRGKAAPTTGTVQITYPLTGASLGVAGTRVQLRVTNFVLDPNVIPCGLTDHGRIRLYVNDALILETSDTNASRSSLTLSDTRLGVQLVCTDGSSFDPQVWHNITIAVGEPSVTITRPPPPRIVSTAGTRLEYTIANFMFDPGNYAGPSIPGQGHVHVLRNGSLVGTSVAPFADVSNLPPGPSSLMVELHNNDHSLVTTASHPFGYNHTIAATAVVPSIRVVSPAPGGVVSGSGFRMTVSVTGIELDTANYGGTQIPGHGHMHYFIDGGGLAATSTTPFVDFGSMPVGPHSIKAELHNNDHSLYTDPTHPAGFNTTVIVNVVGPSIAIISPAANAAVSSQGFRITVAVAGLVIDPENYGGTNIPGRGHVHFYEGTTLLGTSTTTSMDLVLGPGPHTIRAELRNNDHSALVPAISAQVLVTVGAPALRILEPVGGSGVSTLGFRMRFAVSNFSFDAAGYGGLAVPGQGHIHVYVGTTLLITTVFDHAVIGGLPPGAVTLRAELRNNDHSALGAAITTTVDLTVTAPSIALSAPTSIAAGQDLLVTWTVSGFILDGAAFGGAPETGRGHVHVFVDGTYVTATPGTSFSQSGLAVGSHTIRVELYNNDHSALAQQVSSERTVAVNAGPAPSPAAVEATIFYGSVGLLAVLVVALAALLMRKGRKGPPQTVNPEQVEVEK